MQGTPPRKCRPSNFWGRGSPTQKSTGSTWEREAFRLGGGSLLQATFPFSPLPEVKELVLVPLHAAPEAAVTEIDALYDVYQDVKGRWGATVSASPGGVLGLFFLQHKMVGCELVEELPSTPVLGRHILLFPLAGCPSPGRLQRRLQVRQGGGLALHPPALHQGLPVAHPGHGRYHGDQHRLCL